MRKKRILSEEHKRKIGLSLLGKKRIISEEAIKNIQIAAAKRKGIKTGPMPEEIKKKISEANKGKKKTLTGPNKGWFPKGQRPIKAFKKGHLPWNKGKLLGNGRASRKYKIWRQQVKERDGNKCVKCGSTDRTHAHHIIPWKENNELRFHLSNGLTLCNSCHSKEECVLGIVGIATRYKKGHEHSEKEKVKMSFSHKGKTPWNKGIAMKETTREKLKKALKGRKVWNKGKKMPGFINSGSFKKGQIPWNKKEV